MVIDVFYCFYICICLGIPQWLSGKESVCSAGDMGLIPGSGRSPGGCHSNPLQYSCLENLMDWGACWATGHRVAKSQAWLKWMSPYPRVFACTFPLYFPSHSAHDFISSLFPFPKCCDRFLLSSESMLRAISTSHSLCICLLNFCLSDWYLL